MFLFRFFFLILICTSLLKPMKAQTGFDLAATLGFNASQIAGDALAGYDKFGLTGGLKLGYPFKEKFNLNMELLYSQKGSKSKKNQVQQKTHFDYFEVPVYVTINDWYIEKEDYYKVSAHAGLAYAYLFRLETLVDVFTSDIENFRNWDMSFIMGASFAFNPKVSATIRYTNSFIRIYKNDVLTTKGLINYLWTFRADYNF